MYIHESILKGHIVRKYLDQEIFILKGHIVRKYLDQEIFMIDFKYKYII